VHIWGGDHLPGVRTRGNLGSVGCLENSQLSTLVRGVASGSALAFPDRPNGSLNKKCVEEAGEETRIRCAELVAEGKTRRCIYVLADGSRWR
jgi:hypothetical protein